MPERKIASLSEHEEIVFPEYKGELNVKTKFLPTENLGEVFLYLSFTDQQGKEVDVDESSLSLRRKDQKEKLKISIERAGAGEYYLKWKHDKHDKKIQLELLYGEERLGPQLEYHPMVQIDFEKSSLKVIEKDFTTFKFELKLVDNGNRPVSESVLPEILFEGSGHLSALKQVAPGVWHFYLLAPNENQIMYFGAQLNGQRQRRLLRLQYVEE